jgi:hypothetical protein
MKVTMLRKGSRGIAGTYDNIDHHAKTARPIVEIMEKVIPTLGFQEWSQGNNIHKLFSANGNVITCRPLLVDGKYGIRFAREVSRTNEIFLYDLLDVGDVPECLTLLRALNKTRFDNKYHADRSI